MLGELARTLGSAQAVPRVPGAPAPLTELRDRLNSISEELHSPIGETGETPFSVLARQTRFIGAGVPAPSIKIDRLVTLNRRSEQKLCEALQAYSDLLQQAGSPARHPLQGVRRLDLQPVDLARLSSVLAEARQHAQTLAQGIQATQAATGLSTNVTPRSRSLPPGRIGALGGLTE